jgi:pimeloyl-ACP methyl ester carboxylesterase
VPKVLANGIEMHYQQAGQGQDVVLIHGVTGDLSTWYIGVMPSLAKEFRVTAYDLRGHGYSEGTPSGYTSAHLAADLDDLMENLGIKKAHIVAHSFGASVALHTAVLYPDRVASLVLADPGLAALQPCIDLTQWPYLRDAQAMLKKRGLSIPDDKFSDLVYIARQTLSAPRLVPFGLRKQAERSNRRLQRLLDTTSALTEAQEVAGLTLERIGEVRQPTLVIFGETSRWLQTAQRLQETLPNCRVTIVKKAAHFFALSKPKVLVRHVRRFLGELGGNRTCVFHSTFMILIWGVT